MINKQKPIFVVISAILIFASFIPYLVYWSSGNISLEKDDWIFLFGYLQSFVSPVMVLVSIYLAYKSLVITIEKNNDDQKTFLRIKELEEIKSCIENQSQLIDKYIDKTIYSKRYVMKDNKEQYETICYVFKDMYIVNSEEARESKFYTDNECKILIDIGYYFTGLILHINTLLEYMFEYSNICETPDLLNKHYKNKYSSMIHQFIANNDFYIPYYNLAFESEKKDAEKVLQYIKDFFNIKKNCLTTAST